MNKYFPSGWTQKDSLWLGLLLFLAFFIWARDRAWMSTADDTLPILAALPLMVWLGSPWTFSNETKPISFGLIIVSILLILAGIIFDWTTLLALAWTLLAWVWLSKRVDVPPNIRLKKLLVLGFLAFPWISLDLTALGWWFRLSAAHVDALVFSWAGQDVLQSGTNLIINKLPFSVDVACAGLNTLQSMLIAGTAIDYLLLGNSNKFWWNLPLLFVMAWIANCLRILLLTLSALVISPEFSMGAFHTFGGWLVILLMFLLCMMIFYLQSPKKA